MENYEEKKSRVLAKFSEKFDSWHQSQEGQNDAYAFEESYVKFIHEVGHEILQEVVGSERDSRKKKR